MRLTPAVKAILANYESDNPGSKEKLARIMMHGRLGGTGKMVILPVDQGFEHGPARSFAINPDAYDPHFHFSLAVESGCSAYAAPLGPLEAGASTFAGEVPLILKMNSANSLSSGNEEPDQAVTASIDDALRLGCAAIGFTIYPGSDRMYDMMEEFRELSAEAKAAGLAVVLWSYARGGTLSKDGETGLDVISYAAHIATLLGPHIIKVKLPTDHLEQPEAKKAYEKNNIARATQADRVRDVMKSCFNGRRIVVFSGGATKDENGVYDDARAIRDGGGHGSIIGRNSFQRPKADALKMLSKIMDIYEGKA